MDRDDSQLDGSGPDLEDAPEPSLLNPGGPIRRAVSRHGPDMALTRLISFSSVRCVPSPKGETPPSPFPCFAGEPQLVIAVLIIINGISCLSSPVDSLQQGVAVLPLHPLQDRVHACR